GDAWTDPGAQLGEHHSGAGEGNRSSARGAGGRRRTAPVQAAALSEHQASNGRSAGRPFPFRGQAPARVNPNASVAVAAGAEDGPSCGGLVRLPPGARTRPPQLPRGGLVAHRSEASARRPPPELSAGTRVADAGCPAVPACRLGEGAEAAR